MKRFTVDFSDGIRQSEKFATQALATKRFNELLASADSLRARGFILRDLVLFEQVRPDSSGYNKSAYKVLMRQPDGSYQYQTTWQNHVAGEPLVKCAARAWFEY